MTNITVHARIDEQIKAEAALVLDTMGLTVSDAVRMMLIRVARDKVLPFDPLIPNEKTIAAIRDAKAGRTETVTMDDIREIIRNERD